MRVSRKSDYALRALVTLADRFGEAPVSIRELAEENDIPKRFLEQIMLDLKHKGWVRSVAGRDGGFALARRPETISMGEIVRHFDGVLAPIGCVSTSNYESCSQEAKCRFRRVFLEVRNYTAGIMDGTSLAALQVGRPVARQEVFSEQFTDGGGI